MIKTGKKIYSILSQDQAVSALIGSKIYPLIAPEGTELPYVLYQRSFRNGNSKDGRTGSESSINIGIFAKSYVNSIDICDAIEKALTGYRDGEVKSITLDSGDEQFQVDAFIQGLIFTVKSTGV